MSKSEIDWDHVESVRKLKQSLHEKRQKRNQDLSEVSGSFKNESFRDNTYGGQTSVSYDDFKYDSVTRNIYEKFGKEKQYCDYPQKIPPPAPVSNKLPDLKRIKAERMRKIWENDEWTRQQNSQAENDHRNNNHHNYYRRNQRNSNGAGGANRNSIQNAGADENEKFLDKILTLKNYI